MAKKASKRTKVKDLQKPKRELTGKDLKKIKGGGQVVPVDQRQVVPLEYVLPAEKVRL